MPHETVQHLDHEAIIEFIREGRIDVGDPISHVFSFERDEEAYATALDPTSGRFKVMIRVSDYGAPVEGKTWNRERSTIAAIFLVAIRRVNRH